MPFDFGRRLHELRKKKNLSQQQVAERIHVSKASISGYENNLTTPSLDVLVQLALLYGVSTDYLVGLEHRKMVNLDGFTEPQQKLVMSILDLLCRLAGPAGGKEKPGPEA